MAQPYVGEIRLFAGNFAPAGWHLCNGSPLPISENETLFQLIGTTYGGNGETTFNLPDLRGRVPVHRRTNGPLGEMGGVEEVTLTVNQLPAHAPTILAASAIGTQSDPAGSLLAEHPGGVALYIEDAPATSLSPQAMAPVGGSQPHTNLQPSLCLNFIISLFGIYPSPT